MMVSIIDCNFWNGNKAKAPERFDCGNSEINCFLKEKIVSDKRKNQERLILVADDESIYGFISVSLGEVRTSFFKKENHIVLVVNAIGIDKSHQNNGYGTQLLMIAYQLALTVNQVIPIGGLYLVALVDAYDFYKKFDLINLNAPPEFVPGQQEFQMVISIDQIESLGLSPFSNPIDLSS